MKKTIYTMIVLLACFAGNTFADGLVVNNISIGQGNKIKYGFEFENEEEYRAFQFAVTLPEGITMELNDRGAPLFTFGERLEGTDFTLTPAVLKSGAYNFPAYSPYSTDVIPGNSGALFYVTIVADENVAKGTYTATVSNIEFVKANVDRETVYWDDFTFNITVTDHVNECVVLDEMSTVMPEESTEPVDVNVKRTINSGEWTSIVLPFALTGEQVSTFFGSDVKIGNLKSVVSTTDDDEAIIGINVSFDEVDATTAGIEANHPYIIKTTQDISEFTVENVTLEVEEEPTVMIGATKKTRSYFIGTYVDNTTVPEETLFFTDGTLKYSNGSDTMQGMRAYLNLVDVLDSYYDGNVDASNVCLMFGNVKIKVKDATRAYGDDNPDFEYELIDGDVVGNFNPEITTSATNTSAAGTYDIIASGCDYEKGTLTIEKAPLTITAKSYTRKQGEANPTFEADYEGFKNSETSTVLTKQPVFTCDATAASAPGEYDINVSGAEAQNYEISYVKGILTVEQVSGIENVLIDGKHVDVYGINGVLYKKDVVSPNELPQGVYIINGRKYVVK